MVSAILNTFPSLADGSTGSTPETAITWRRSAIFYDSYSDHIVLLNMFYFRFVSFLIWFRLFNELNY